MLVLLIDNKMSILRYWYNANPARVLDDIVIGNDGAIWQLNAFATDFQEGCIKNSPG
jgi:hypothetical protein